MGVLRVERVSGWGGVRVSWPVPEDRSPETYFGALLPAYTSEGPAVAVAALGAFVADVALHADLIARPTRLGLADGNVTVSDRAVPLRVGVELPPGLVLPVTAARLVQWTEGRADATALVRVSASTVRAWDTAGVAGPRHDESVEPAELERRRYFLALCRVIREATYDVVQASADRERAGGVPLGQVAGGSVLLVGPGAATVFDLLKGRDADVPSSSDDRARRWRVATAARAYVLRLATFESGGRRELPPAAEEEQRAAADVERAAASELALWQSATRPAAPREGAMGGLKLGPVAKLAVGLFVVKTVLGD